MSKELHIIYDSAYLVGYWHPRGMLIVPTAEGMEEFRELEPRDEAEALEDWLCNGWMMVDPAQIGALTDAPIISQDATLEDDGSVDIFPGGAVYAHMNYAVENPISMWKEGKGVVWDAYWTIPVFDVYYDDDGVKVWVIEKVEFKEWNLEEHVKEMEKDELFSEFLRSILASNENITDRSRKVVYAGSDVQDHLTKLDVRSPMDLRSQ